MIQTVDELFGEIDKHFLAEVRLGYYDAFAKTGRNKKGRDTGKQLEHWFKGELIYLFSSLQQQRQILTWDCELKKERIGQIDFTVEIDDKPSLVYLEMKTMYLGWQGEYHCTPSTYSAPVGNDVQKLAKCEQGSKFCLLFVYPCSQEELGRWEDFVTSIQSIQMEPGGALIPVQIDMVDLERYSPLLCIIKVEIFPLSLEKA